MFFGEFGYRIDEKGRVPIPPKFRSDLQAGVVLTTGMENYITIYPTAEWKKLADSLTSGPIPPSKLRRINRAIFASAFSTDLDRQGRIIVPPLLRQHAGLKEEVVIAGTNTTLELWGKEQWEEEKTASQKAAWQDIESLERRS